MLTEYEGQPWRVALYCEEGHWVSAEDGVCGDGRQAACRVAGVTYPHGARRIPSPFDCNECECDDGQLICNEAGCPDDDVTCPEGTSLVSRCVACSGGAAMSQCSLVETGCVTEEECPGAACGVACI
ncbi:MAG: hypothetical protein EOO73_12870 [Myxococcales bacterium]|nr:MAG: hypothetical protein EOO73_12870 [Myxococcales bacterium]